MRDRPMRSDTTVFKQRRSEVRQLDTDGKVAPFLAAAQALVEDFPDQSAAWLDLGIALTDVARYDEALRALNKSIRLMKPKYRQIPYACKGHLFRAKGNYRSAKRWYRRAIESDPRNADWWAFLGSLLAKQGRLSEAKDVWQRQIKLDTGATDEGHLNLGLIYRAEQKYELALHHAKEAIALDPGYKEALRLQSDLLEVMRKSRS